MADEEGPHPFKALQRSSHIGRQAGPVLHHQRLRGGENQAHVKSHSAQIKGRCSHAGGHPPSFPHACCSRPDGAHHSNQSAHRAWRRSCVGLPSCRPACRRRAFQTSDTLSGSRPARVASAGGRTFAGKPCRRGYENEPWPREASAAKQRCRSDGATGAACSRAATAGFAGACPRLPTL